MEVRNMNSQNRSRNLLVENMFRIYKLLPQAGSEKRAVGGQNDDKKHALLYKRNYPVSVHADGAAGGNITI